MFGIKITAAQFWMDVGFNESDRIVPAISNLATLPTATYSLDSTDELYPSPDKLFSELHIKEPAVRLMYMSYMKLTVEYQNQVYSSEYPPAVQTIYGWIDSVEAKSDNNRFPMTVVRWHIDYWRTYAASATYTSGRVDRITNLGTLCKRYKQPFQDKYFKVSDYHSLITLEKPMTMWVYLTVNYQSSTSLTTVMTNTYCFPIKTDVGRNTIYYISNVNDAGNAHTCMSSDDIFTGLWSSYFSIPLENIKYACLSPVAPVVMEGTGASDDPFRPLNGRWHVTDQIFNTSVTPKPWAFKLKADSFYWAYPSFETRRIDLSSYNVITDEKNKWIITGFDGETIHEIPYGMLLKEVTYRTIISSVSGYLEFRGEFYDTAQSEYYDARSNGICAVIPLIPLELSSNSFSSYQYSGQREYDINSATTQRDKALINSLLGLGGSTMGGAITGSMTKAGGAVGAAAGLGVGVLSAAGTYASSQYFDSVEQGNRDRLASAQPDTMLMAGSGFDVIDYGQSIKIKKLSADQDSQDHFDNIIANEGYLVGDYISTGLDTALRSLTGAVKISELKIGGNLPAVAKAYIKQRFANGVILS